MNKRERVKLIIENWFIEKTSIKPTEEGLNNLVDRIVYDKQLTLTDVSSSLPDLAECNQASLDYANKKENPDFFLIKQTFKEGINWALNYITKPK